MNLFGKIIFIQFSIFISHNDIDITGCGCCRIWLLQDMVVAGYGCCRIWLLLFLITILMLLGCYYFS